MMGNKNNQQVTGKHAAMPEQQPTAFMPVGPAAAAEVAEKKGNFKKPLLIALLSVVIVLGVAYGAGFLFFSGHFFPNTTLNDTDLSLQSSDVLAQDIQAQADSYTLTISGQDFEHTFEQGDMGIDLDAQAIAEEAAQRQDVPLWFIECFKQHDVSDIVVASYDEAAFTSALTAQIEAFNKEKTAPQDATVAYDSNMNTFTVKPEVAGTQISVDTLVAKAGQCVKEMRTTCEVTEDDLIKPKVLSSDERMMDAAQKAISLFPQEVTLTLASKEKGATIDLATIGSWLYINPDDYSLNLNKDSLAEWVNGKTANLGTVGTERTWTREDGKQCTASGGTYGWQVDTSSLADTVYNKLLEGGATSIDIPCSQTGDVYNGAGARDWGAYVDVDISEQHARYYDANGTLLHECNFVSGKDTADRRTPTGIYMLNSKQSPCTLVGYNSSGSIDYETKVQYWMPFIGNSIGLHDATWRSSFGGSIWKTSGSHGCINLATSDAQWFYNNLSTGVCVITHY